LTDLESVGARGIAASIAISARKNSQIEDLRCLKNPRETALETFCGEGEKRNRG
jgi:hypothetical protein